MLNISNITVETDHKVILDDFSLTIDNQEVCAIMGPNGVGKSTICKVLMGDSNYIVTKGKIIFNNQDILKLSVDERAKLGIFLLNQSPIEIPGVTNAEMLRMALSSKHGHVVSIFEFNKKMESICEKLELPKSFIHRGINEGMSGGERKKNELLHMWMLEPSLIILDEIDSGLDIDSLKIVWKNIKEYHEKYNCSILIISHHSEILKAIDVDTVHILNNKKIVRSGDLALALEIEKNGYHKLIKANSISESDIDE